MRLHLPAELLAICDLSTLQLASGSFVEDSLRPYFSDVLYSLKTTSGEAYVHVLIEHQSAPDKHMAFRLMRYAVAALTLLQKHIHQRDLADLLDRLAILLLTEQMTGQQLVSLINYLLQTGETSEAEAFVRQLAQQVPQHEDQLMTIAQQLEQKGIEKGIEKGFQLGRQEGRTEGERAATLKIAYSMLQNGIDPSTISKVTGLSSDELAQIPH